EVRSRAEPGRSGRARAGALERSQRCGLSAGAVQRNHEIAPEPLAERVLADQDFEVGYEIGRFSEVQPCAREILEREGAELFEAVRFERTPFGREGVGGRGPRPQPPRPAPSAAR